jgi:hypothetical protein
MWRHGRRNGLKIEVFAVSFLFVALQFNRVFPGKLRKIRDFAARTLGWAENPSLLLKFLHMRLSFGARRPADLGGQQNLTNELMPAVYKSLISARTRNVASLAGRP